MTHNTHESIMKPKLCGSHKWTTSFTKINDQTEAWRDMKNDLQDTPYCQNNKDRTLAQNNIVCE